MIFLDQLSLDAAATFINEFAESITYVQWQNGAAAITLTFSAIINRNAPSLLTGLQGATNYKHEIGIVNTATTTIGLPAINVNKDAVWFSTRVDKAPEKFIVREVIANDQGVWHLGVG